MPKTIEDQRPVWAKKERQKSPRISTSAKTPSRTVDHRIDVLLKITTFRRGGNNQI